MYKTELELEKRLNDIALANVPTGSSQNIVIVPRMKHNTALVMSPDEFDLRDLAIEQKMNVISLNAIVDKLGWKPSKIKSNVTKEMIADYQLEQMKNMKQGLYIPASVDLDLLDDPVPPAEDEVLNPRAQTIATRTMRANGDRILEIQAELSSLPRFFQSVKDEWGLRLGQALARADRLAANPVQRSTFKLRIRREFDAELAQLETDRNDYEYELRVRLNNFEAESAALAQSLQDSASKLSAYQSELSAVRDENARRRKIYQDQIRTLNTGINFTPMLPDETADEYKERLKDIGDSTSNGTAVEAAASLLYTDRLREKMAEITRDDVLIADFIRRLTTDERYSLVKIFETFKKKVLEIFGVNNQFMSASDLTNIAEELADIVAIQAIAEPVQFKEEDEREVSPLKALVVEEGTDPEVSRRSSPFFIQPDLSGFDYPPFVIRETTGRKLSDARAQAIMEVANRGGEGKKFVSQNASLNLFYQEEIERAKDYFRKREKAKAKFLKGELSASSSSPALSPRSSRIIDLGESRPPDEPTLPELQVAIQAVASELADEDQKDRLLASLTNPATGAPRSKEDLFKLLRTAGLLDIVLSKVTRVGRGLRGRSVSDKYPKIQPFGLIEVSPHKLFYENILKITRKGKHLTGFPNVKVSNEFVSFIFKVLDGEQPTLRDVNKLSVGEKQLFDSVVFTAGLQKKVESTGSGVKQKLKDRIALIEGEIEAGNTSDELIKEARQILQHLARMKIIGHRAASGHLKMLINAQRG